MYIYIYTQRERDSIVISSRWEEYLDQHENNAMATQISEQNQCQKREMMVLHREQHGFDILVCRKPHGKVPRCMHVEVRLCCQIFSTPSPG